MDDSRPLGNPMVQPHYGQFGANPRARMSLPALRASLLPRVKQRLSSPATPVAPKSWTTDDIPPLPISRNGGDGNRPPRLTIIVPKWTTLESEGQAVKPLGVYGRGGAGKRKMIQKGEGDDGSIGSRTPTSARTWKSNSSQSTVMPTQRTGVTPVAKRPVRAQGGYGRGGAGRAVVMRTGSARAKKDKGKDKARKSEGGKKPWFGKRKAEAKSPSTGDVPAHSDAPAQDELDAKATQRPTPDVGGTRTDVRPSLPDSCTNAAAAPQAQTSSTAAIETHTPHLPVRIGDSSAPSPKDGDLQRAFRPPLQPFTGPNEYLLPPRSSSLGVDSRTTTHPRPGLQVPPILITPPGSAKGQHRHPPRSPLRANRSLLPAPGPPPSGPLPPIPKLSMVPMRQLESHMVCVC